MASTDTFRRALHFTRFRNMESQQAVYGAPEFTGMDRCAIVEDLTCVLISPACSHIDRSKALMALCQCADMPEVAHALLSVAGDLLAERSPQKGSLNTGKIYLGFIIYDAFFRSIGRRILEALPPPGVLPQKSGDIPNLAKKPTE